MRLMRHIKEENVMKMKVLCIGIMIGCILAGCGKQTKSQEPEISVLEGSYAIDVDSFSELAGSADYVIVGKVTDELDTLYKWPVMLENEDGTKREVSMPYTNFSVEVVKNLKGELSQEVEITITKSGGLTKDGNMYVLDKNDILPSVDGSYVFYIYAQEDGSNLSVGPNSTIPLDDVEGRKVSTRYVQDEGQNSDRILEQVMEGVEHQIISDRERSVSNDDVAVKK